MYLLYQFSPFFSDVFLGFFAQGSYWSYIFLKCKISTSCTPWLELHLRHSCVHPRFCFQAFWCHQNQLIGVHVLELSSLHFYLGEFSMCENSAADWLQRKLLPESSRFNCSLQRLTLKCANWANWTAVHLLCSAHWPKSSQGHRGKQWFAFSVKADVSLNSCLEAEGSSGVHSKNSIRLKADSSSRQSEALINNHPWRVMKFKKIINWQYLFDTIEMSIHYKDTFLLFKQATLEMLLHCMVAPQTLSQRCLK